MSSPAQKSRSLKATHRLLGMVVQEVSLVDHAANKRQFLLVKRDATMTTPAAPVAAPATAQTQKDTPADGGEGSGAEPTDGGGGIQLQAQVKDALLAELAKCGEMLITLANTVKDAQVTDQATDPPVPADLLGSIGEVASKLSAIASADGSGQGAETGAPGDMGAPMEMSDAEKAAVGKAFALLKSELNCTDVRAGQLIGVAKVGRRMAKERMERFRKAIDLLVTIMKELSLDVTRKAAGPAALPAGHVAIEQATLAKMENGVAELLTQVKGVQSELESTKSQLVKANEKIATLSKATGAPQSGPRETTPQPASKAVAWPFDLNKPITPNNTQPSKSFYGNR